VQAAYHIRTTNEAGKKTHPLNSEEIATSVTGENPVRTFSFLEQAKAMCAKLQQRKSFESSLKPGFLTVVILRYHHEPGYGENKCSQIDVENRSITS
jgi:hypothetical protein